MNNKRFSYKIDICKVTFDVRGNIDLDGLPDIDCVEVNDSIINLWPAICESSLGDMLFDAAKHLLAHELCTIEDELANTSGLGYDGLREERFNEEESA